MADDEFENSMGYTVPSTESEVEVMGDHLSSRPPKIPRPKKKRSIGNRTSKVWDHFTKLDEHESKDPRASCNYCGSDFSCDSRKCGTSTMWFHLDRCNDYPYREKKQKNSKEGDGGSPSVGNPKTVYSVEECRLALTEMIIIDELPFSHVEGQGFKKFCHVMQPKFHVPSRITVARDCAILFKIEKDKLKKALKYQRICLTTDCWTSIQNINYMCLTGHWIDDDWNLHKRILNFFQVPNHKGETIGRAIMVCLSEWGVDSIFTITVDNASSNDAAIKHVKKKTKDWKSTILENEFLHVRCSAHIVNLIVCDGLKEADESIVKIRNAVRYVRSSPARLQLFKRCIEKEEIQSKSLVCLDLPTRWNSTYLMLEAAEKFQKAFEQLEEFDPNFYLYFWDDCNIVDENEFEKGREKGKVRGKGKQPPTNDDWASARVFIRFLKLFYKVTTKFSGSLHVTSNLFFREVVIVQVTLGQLCKSGDNLLTSMAESMRMKFDKYWGNVENNTNFNWLLYVAIVLDPRYKFQFVNYMLNQVHEPWVVEEIIKKVKDTLIRLYDYHVKGDVTIPSGSQASQRNVVELEEEDTHAYFDFQYKKLLEEKDSIESKSEVERYLVENCEDPSNADFDILKWWKLNSPKYRMLSRVARDVLAIPISTVASESAFSTGGRVLDPFRSSLAPQTIETLVCTQNWLRSPSIPIDLRDAMDEVEKYEEIILEVSAGFSASSNEPPILE